MKQTENNGVKNEILHVKMFGSGCFFNRIVRHRSQLILNRGHVMDDLEAYVKNELWKKGKADLKAAEEENQRLERFLEKRQQVFDSQLSDLWSKIDKLNHQIRSCTCGVVIRDLLPPDSQWIQESDALIDELSSPEEFTEESLNRLHELTEKAKS